MESHEEVVGCARVHAYLAGCNRFAPELAPLCGCEQDVVRLADVMKSVGFEVGHVVKGAEFDRTHLLNSVRLWARNIAREDRPDALMLIYVATHGFVWDNEHYLACDGGSWKNRDSLLAVVQLRETLMGALSGCTHPPRMLFVLDACRSHADHGQAWPCVPPSAQGTAPRHAAVPPIGVRAMLRRDLEQAFKGDGTSPIETIIWASCLNMQCAIEDTDRGRGFFALALEETLNQWRQGNLSGEPTLSRLFGHVNNALRKATDERQQSAWIPVGDLSDAFMNLCLMEKGISGAPRQHMRTPLPSGRTASARQTACAAELGAWAHARTRALGLALSLIPPGEPMIGHHRVHIRTPFYLGTCPVTEDEWESVMGESAPYRTGGTAPARGMGWDLCQDFLRKLDALEGLAAGTFALPGSEAWLYACHMGSVTHFGLDQGPHPDDAHFAHGDWSAPAPVAGKRPNAWGLYDMQGNIFEFCARDVRNNTDVKVARGGCWCSSMTQCSGTYGLQMHRWEASPHVGLRVALPIAPETLRRLVKDD